MESATRLPAEWEPQSAVQFTFPHPDTDWADMLDDVIPCFLDCIRAVSRFEQVLIVCNDLKWVDRQLANLDRTNLILAELPSNDTWARDHGGITILVDNQPVILDFVFNGWGLKFAADKDNLITSGLKRLGIFGSTPVVPGGIALEGGGIESDGQGTLMTTTHCLLSPNRNPHMDQAATEAFLKQRFGLKRVLWLRNGYLAGDDTDSHIDTLARFCDPETIAYVQCTDESDEHYEALRLMEQELKAFRTPGGQPYRLVPLPMPSPVYAEEGYRLPATYANFLIINGAVLVPVYGVPEDDAAVERLRPLFPGREIIAIDCSALIRQHGSLHCISMQYPLLVVS